MKPVFKGFTFREMLSANNAGLAPGLLSVWYSLTLMVKAELINIGISEFNAETVGLQAYNVTVQVNYFVNALMSIADKMLSVGTVPCTACHYCVSHCPQGLDIPHLISLYNEHTYTGGGFIAPMALGALPEDKRPQACLGCRSCEQVCPQQIKISEVLAAFSEKLG